MCLTESAVLVSTSRAFQNTTTFDLRLISHRGRAARSSPIKILAPCGAITWIAVNSYPGKVVLGSYPKVRIEPACNNFVALVEVVPEGIRTNFTLVT